METKQIQKRLAEISREEQELKTAKKNIKEQLENDLEYVEARNEAKKAAQKKRKLLTPKVTFANLNLRPN